MEVTYKKRFLKDLKSIPAKSQLAIKSVLDSLRNSDSLETANVDYIKMEGQKPGRNYYRIRIGQYRMGIEYVQPNVLVIMVAVRGGFYHAFPPK